MTTYSPAAQAYASRWWVAETNMWHELGRTYDAAFDAGAASVAQPTPRTLTTAAELGAIEGTDAVLCDATGQVWRWGGGWWRMTGDDDGFTSVYVTEKHRLPLTLLVPATAAPEPERLTDPDDPRIRAGALVETTYPSDDGESVTYRHRIVADVCNIWDVHRVRERVASALMPILLIEEAPDPDPDADARTAVAEVVGELCGVDITDGDCGEILKGLRERGVAK